MERQRYMITCSQCGATDTVPFEPDGERPVYCQACHRKRREEGIKRHERLAEAKRKAEEPPKERKVIKLKSTPLYLEEKTT